MNSAVTSLLLALAGLVPVALEAKTALAAHETRIAGRGYVSLSVWAKANGLEIRWLKRDETVQLSNRSTRLVFHIDSRQAEANGIQVWLSFAPVQHGGAVCLDRLDLETTVQPILVPPRNSVRDKIKTVCLDPGHGGKDPGYCVGSRQEKKYTLLLAQELRQQLGRAGLKATLTRARDSFIELPVRPDLANRQKADLFVSLHFNASETDRATVQGAQVFCLTPAGAQSTNAQGEGGGAGWCTGNRCNDKNLLLACRLQKALTGELAVQDRGVRRARFAVLRDAQMPAVLIEAGFMSHPMEGKKIFSAAYRKEMAQAIVDGLLAYKRTVEREALVSNQ
ncbi:MAG TPA: N-acetylmuramoyl-L-alanine amidase [Candidatus Binatia bacterium]|jgi:N-acetylmuramoyl-L-alanine amidase|nr:N-acetylmuramoyl-L-alanine amidase [Candidatus Binatia bacterium]